MTENRWQRLGGACGVLYVALYVATFFTPTTPDAGDPTAAIAGAIAADRTGLIAGAYLDGLAAVLFLLFAVALARRLRFGAVAACGTAVAVGSLVATAVTLALVQSAHEQRESAAVRALFELDELVTLPFAFAVAGFLAAAAMAMPARALGRVAGVLAAVILVGLLGLFSDDEAEGGPLGIALTLGLLAHYLWILAAGLVMARGAVRGATRLAPAVAAGLLALAVLALPASPARAQAGHRLALTGPATATTGSAIVLQATGAVPGDVVLATAGRSRATGPSPAARCA